MKRVRLSQDYFALVSDEDFERVSAFKWCVSAQGRKQEKLYAIRVECRANGKREKIRMHRFILGLPNTGEDARIVHHVADNGLNNQRENLEILGSQSENMGRSPGWRRKREEPFL